MIEGQLEEARQLVDTLPDYKFKMGARASLAYYEGKFELAEQIMLNDINKYHHHRIDYISWYRYLTVYRYHAIKTTKHNNYESAWNYIKQGLYYGDDGAYAWGTFIVLRSALDLLIEDHLYEEATELLSLMLHHPLNTGQNRKRVLFQKDRLKALLPADKFEAAWQRGKDLNLADVITQYMER